MTTTRYRDVRLDIWSGDLGLVRAFPHGAIAYRGRSKYSHAFTPVWRSADQATLAIAESREGRGGQVLTLSSQVRRFPGMIDIYRPKAACPGDVCERAATIAFNWAGHGYNYPGVFDLWLVHNPMLRRVAEEFGKEFYLDDMRPTDWDEPKICSQLHAWAYRKAIQELYLPGEIDWDPVPNLGDRWIEPGDLHRSGSYDLICEGLVI